MGRLLASIAIVAALLLPACRRKGPPYSPAEAQRLFHIEPGFRVELAASEPVVVDAVAIDFDEDGRIWAAEMADYPMGETPRGRIRLLEDRDGDGVYEHGALFAEGLPMPTGVMRWRKGVLVAAAPDILYLEDTNNDGRADTREVVLTGFATTNPQLRVNGLQYGLDNWIYAAYPRVLATRRYVKEFGDKGGPIRFVTGGGDKGIEPRSQDIRFRPDRHLAEAVAGNSQFGHSFDAWGRRFTLWNNDHVRHAVVPETLVHRNAWLAAPATMHSASDHGNAATVYPATRDPEHIHDSQIGHFTSACGLSIYTGGRFPAPYDGSSFVCEPVHNLVHRDVLAPLGATFNAARGETDGEFLSSEDAWFRPVFTTIGPDGALYIVDYYRRVIEHPEWVPPQLMKQIDFHTHHQLGRIWRVVHESAGADRRRPRLGGASANQLVANLSDPNRWWRITAQRLLVDRRDVSVVPALKELATRGTAALGRLHALWTLEGLDALDDETLLTATADADAGVRENAAMLASSRITAGGSSPAARLLTFHDKILLLAADPDVRVRFQAAVALGDPAFPRDRAVPVLERLLLQHIEDRWFRLAVLSAAREDVAAWISRLLSNAAFREAAGGSEQAVEAKKDMIRRLAAIVGARGVEREIASVISFAASSRERQRPASPAGEWWRPALLEGLADGLRQGSADREKLGSAEPALVSLLSDADISEAAARVGERVELRDTQPLRAALLRAAVLARDEAVPLEVRVRAVRVVALDRDQRPHTLLVLMAPTQPRELQSAAARALAANLNPAAVPAIVDNWRGLAIEVRERLTDAILADRAGIEMLLDAIERGRLQPWSLGNTRTERLLAHADPAIQARARAAIKPAPEDTNREAVYQRYLPALEKGGDAERGWAVFRRSCAQCHRAGGEGQEVGPDLRTVTTRYKETLLSDILTPSRAIEPGYEEFVVETADGRTVTGILARDAGPSITLRRARGEEETILRANVREMRAAEMSPMPDGLEKEISVEQMADLIAFIKSLRQ